jgi:hypothetical protein
VRRRDRKHIAATETTQAHHARYIAGETVCCDQSGLTRRPFDMLNSALALAGFRKVGLTDPPIMNSAGPACESMLELEHFTLTVQGEIF